MKDSLKVRDVAVLIGLNPQGQCVYSEITELGDYWDGEHVWDDDKDIKELQMEKLKGYLFDSSGVMLQEFECVFDLSTGIFKAGWARHSDGTFQQF